MFANRCQHTLLVPLGPARKQAQQSGAMRHSEPLTWALPWSKQGNDAAKCAELLRVRQAVAKRPVSPDAGSHRDTRPMEQRGGMATLLNANDCKQFLMVGHLQLPSCPRAWTRGVAG